MWLPGSRAKTHISLAHKKGEWRSLWSLRGSTAEWSGDLFGQVAELTVVRSYLEHPASKASAPIPLPPRIPHAEGHL